MIEEGVGIYVGEKSWIGTRLGDTSAGIERREERGRRQASVLTDVQARDLGVCALWGIFTRDYSIAGAASWVELSFGH
jgi:hypothetical protein